MTKQEAYQAMLNGYKVRNEYYSPEEFAFINKDGLIELEDGVVAGTQHDEFWAINQAWNDGWEVCGTVVKEEDKFTPMLMDEPKLPGYLSLIDSIPYPYHYLPPPPIFFEPLSNLIPKKVRKDYKPSSQPKIVKRKNKHKTFGKNKK